MLGGRVSETNARFLARSLGAHGVRVVRIVIVSDTIDDVASALRELLATDVELICTTGGLGPTYDDLTMEAVARATGRGLHVDATALALVEERIRAIRRRIDVVEPTLDRLRRKQASLPAGSTVLPPAGTAPGCVLRHGRALIVVLPGPPWELQTMWGGAVSGPGPLSEFLTGIRGERDATFRLWSVIEAELVQALDRLPPADTAQIGIYTRDGELEVVAPASLAGRIEPLLRSEFGVALFSTDERLVDEIVAVALLRRGEVLAVAESCTGGGLGARVTAMPGASEWFAGGVIAYANEAKTGVLGVDPDIIASHGAVSPECARAMADGARRLTGATWGVSITGIAGPEGGTPEKPVGLVWIGVAGPRGLEAHEHHFPRSDREGVRRRAQTAALHHLRTALAG